MYKVSRNYQRFRELLDQGYQLVCFADYRPIYDRMERLVVKAQRIDYDNGQMYWYRVATHGIGVGAWNSAWLNDDSGLYEKNPEDIWKFVNLSFIDPDYSRNDEDERENILC